MEDVILQAIGDVGQQVDFVRGERGGRRAPAAGVDPLELQAADAGDRVEIIRRKAPMLAVFHVVEWLRAGARRETHDGMRVDPVLLFVGEQRGRACAERRERRERDDETHGPARQPARTSRPPDIDVDGGQGGEARKGSFMFVVYCELATQQAVRNRIGLLA